MKLFVTLFLCSLTPFIWASSEYYTPNTTCKCVNRDQCSYKFSNLIEPRAPRLNCPGNLVCCKPEHIIRLNDDNNYDDTPNYPDKPAHHSTKPKCGIRTKISAYKRLVLPAALAALGEFPWQAAILKNYSEGYVFVCGGVLIDGLAIATTAHSVLNLKAENMLVRLGENNVQADPKRRYHHVNARVDKILVKDNFNPDTLENDLAVLCLDKKVRCNEVVSPICLPDSNYPTEYEQRCVISGWGKGSYGGNYSSILRKAHINLVPSDQCQHLLRKRISDPAFVLDPSFVCAGGELGKDACTGDAGGPLSCPNKDGQQILTGLVSWGIGCGEKDVPGVYTDIRHLPNLNWIKTAIKVCRARLYKSPTPVETYPSTKPIDYKPDDYKPADYKPDDYKPADYKPADYKPDDYKPADYKPADYKPDDYKPADYKPDDYKPADYKPDNYKPVEYKPVEYKPVEYKQDGYKPVDYKPVDYKPEELYPQVKPDVVYPSSKPDYQGPLETHAYVPVLPNSIKQNYNPIEKQQNYITNNPVYPSDYKGEIAKNPDYRPDSPNFDEQRALKN